jgi:predicted ATPase with chaperone activity
MGEKYDPEVLERFEMVYKPTREGGEGLQPTFAHARDLAQIAQAIRIRKNEEFITAEIMDEALGQHILIALQRRFTPTLFERIIRQNKH